MAHILCVDNDIAAVQLRRVPLEQAGYAVDFSTSVRHAVALVKSRCYDVIVTEWRVGSETASGILLAAKLEAEIPVVVLSGYVTEAFLAPGPLADIYLDKPAESAELIEILEVLLRERRALKAETPPLTTAEALHERLRLQCLGLLGAADL